MRSLPALAPAGIVFALLLAAAPSHADRDRQPKTYQGSQLIAQEAGGWCSEMRGNANALGLEGKKILLKASPNPKNNLFAFDTDKDQEPLVMEIDPSAGVKLLVTGGSGNGDRSALVELDPAKWKRAGTDKNPIWKYKDKLGSRGGVREAQWKRGRFSIKARGAAWQFAPDGEDHPVTVHIQLGNMWYCSSFDVENASRNDTTQFKARNAEVPDSCVDRMCGNGVQELGEHCDDGNLVAGDGCENACVLGACEGESFASTFEAIQTTIIDRYGCSSFLCHGQYDPATGEPKPETHESGLLLYGAEAADLPANPQGLADVLRKNHEALLTHVPANNAFFTKFVEAGEPTTSLFYQVLFKRTHCDPDAVNPPAECKDLEDTIASEGMPDAASGGVPLSADEVEAVNLWVKGGAPLDGVVKDTPALLAACLPPATALKIEPPPHPGAGVGVQLRSTAWSLPAQSENEVCFPIYYDFTQTSLIPAEQQVDCPESFGGPANHSGKCFRWHQQLLLQDPQSHHSIVHRYKGTAGLADEGWGPWTYKFDDLENPLNGTPCDPATNIDPATGQHEGCSADPVRSAACLSYGPPDWNIGGFSANGGTAPQFSGSQETHYKQELADGVYSLLPMTGVVVFNSHAFNLTDEDTTMNQYLNLWLAEPADQLYETQQIFEADEIFWTEIFGGGGGIPEFPAVLPFQTREFCRTWTAPQNAKLFWLSSHTHRHGVRWRTYGPPNTPCGTADPECVAPEDNDRLIYHSTVYNDPRQLEIRPPLHLTDPDPANRTFLFCSLYDNGSESGSPPVKRHSQSPAPPPISPSIPITVGGPCQNTEKACMSPNPDKRGQLCGYEENPDRFCDSAPGMNDGFCDACPLRGGFTTEDEMFILLGNYFIE